MIKLIPEDIIEELIETGAEIRIKLFAFHSIIKDHKEGKRTSLSMIELSMLTDRLSFLIQVIGKLLPLYSQSLQEESSNLFVPKKQ